MTDIEKRALALVNEVGSERTGIQAANIDRNHIFQEALCRAIEQHEAFKQEVSDVMTYIKALYPTLPRNFNRFIITKPDPLVEVLAESDEEFDPEWDYAPQAKAIRTALDALGLEIRSKNDE